MPYYPQGTRNAAHNPVAHMQPLSTPGNPIMGSERLAQQQQQQHQQQQYPAHGYDSRRRTTTARRSTPDLPATPEFPVPPGRTNVEDLMRSIMSKEMRTLEAQMEQRFSS
ncbi:hypothetical protein TIFTF001_032050 [Ficus carica]|uniref:Uncharacterized protein n=1 Tax=Ficus carica TaxID=3494 RepID=A0AA88DZR2_FICCA|nr:hypothetical protein TIFTF001_032050 [Ficus carica]